MKLSSARDLIDHQDTRARALTALETVLSERASSTEDGVHNAVHIMAFLAREGARALRSGELSEAAALFGMERLFLETHAVRVMAEAAIRMRRDPKAVEIAQGLDALAAESAL